MLDPEQTKKSKETPVGSSYIFNFLDDSGLPYTTPWGLFIPNIKIDCVKWYEGKCLRYDYHYIGDFIFESLYSGVSLERFNDYLYDITGYRGHIGKFMYSDPRYSGLKEYRIQYARDSVMSIQDLDNDKGTDQLRLKLNELKYKARMGVLARIDPEFREKLDQNISGNVAQIIIPKKDEDDDV